MHARVFLLMLSTLYFSFQGFSQSETAKGYKVGDKITDFKLKNVDETFKTLDDFKDEKGIIIIFTCNHCPYSVAYEDRIIAMHQKYAPLGYPVVAINPNDAKAYPLDSYENMKERAIDKGFPFLYLHDETQDIARIFGATRTPHIFIVSNQKKFFKVEYIGGIDDNSHEAENVKIRYAENALNELLKNKPVSQPTTKALGCTIKWKS